MFIYSYYSEENAELNKYKLSMIVDSNTIETRSLVIKYNMRGSIKSLIDPVGNEIDFVYNGGGSNNLLTNIVYSTGLKVKYGYNRIKYKSNHLVKNKDVIRCVKTFNKTSKVGKSIFYEYVSDINVNNYT